LEHMFFHNPLLAISGSGAGKNEITFAQVLICAACIVVVIHAPMRSACRRGTARACPPQPSQPVHPEALAPGNPETLPYAILSSLARRRKAAPRLAAHRSGRSRLRAGGAASAGGPEASGGCCGVKMPFKLPIRLPLSFVIDSEACPT